MGDLVPEYKLVIMQGATRTMTLTVLDNNDDPVDLSGYTAKLEIRDRAGGALISSLTSSSGITINAAAGEVIPLWTATQTGAFNFNIADYDCFITTGSTVTCILRGEVELIQRISQ
jgi:hypothetical protein